MKAFALITMATLLSVAGVASVPLPENYATILVAARAPVPVVDVVPAADIVGWSDSDRAGLEALLREVGGYVSHGSTASAIDGCGPTYCPKEGDPLTFDCCCGLLACGKCSAGFKCCCDFGALPIPTCQSGICDSEHA